MKRLLITFKILLLLTITFLAGRAGRWTIHILLQVFEVQVILYTGFLKTQALGNEAQDIVSSARDKISSLRDSTPTVTVTQPNNDLILEQRISTYAKNLHLIAQGGGFLVGVIVRKILFDTIYGMRQFMGRIHEFIRS